MEKRSLNSHFRASAILQENILTVMTSHCLLRAIPLFFSFVALFRSKGKLTIGPSYSLGSSTQKRFEWLEQVIILNRPANTTAAVAKTKQSKKLETFLRDLYFSQGCQILVIE